MQSSGDSALLSHFSVLIYPFVHNLGEGRARSRRLASLEEVWAPWWSRLDDHQVAEALEASDFFLPYVRGLLYPETAFLEEGPPGKGRCHWVERLRRRCDRGLPSLAERLPANGVVHLTARSILGDPLADLSVVPAPRSNEQPEPLPIPALIDWLDLHLFPGGVGFLVFKARLNEDQPRLSRLIALNNALRRVHPPTSRHRLPTLRLGAAEGLTVADLINFLLRGLVPGSEPPRGFAGLPAALTGDEDAYTDSGPGRAFGERCLLLSYACIKTPCEAEGVPRGAFPSVADRLLFEFGTGVGVGGSVGDPQWAPAPGYVRQVLEDNRLSVWRSWRVMALKEACVFLGTQDVPFNRQSLPHNIEHAYLPLYLYSLNQQSQLHGFAGALVFEVSQSGKHLHAARQVLRRLVAFRNRYWFSVVTRKPLGGQLYRLMQRGLELQELAETVTASVQGAKDYYQDRHDRLVRLVMALVGLVFGPLTAAVGAARMWLAGTGLLGVGVEVTAASGLLALGLWLLPVSPLSILLARGRRSRRRRAPSLSGGGSRSVALPFPQHQQRRAA